MKVDFLTNQLKAAALLAAGTMLSLTAPAAAGTASICAMGVAPCVYDQAGDALGVFQQEGILNRMIGAAWYFVGYDANGFTVDLTTYYTSADCSGQALMISGYVGPDNTTPMANTPPTWAQWDGSNFWSGVGPTMILSPRSQVCHGAECNGNSQGSCLPYSATIAWGWPTFSPAKVIGTPQLKPAPRNTGCGGSTGVACMTVR